jgi:hypothetical protein
MTVKVPEDPRNWFGISKCFLVCQTGRPARAALEIVIMADGIEQAQILTVTEAKDFHRGLGKAILWAEDINRHGH